MDDKKLGRGNESFKVLHPEYSSVASKILEETESESGYCLLDS